VDVPAIWREGDVILDLYEVKAVIVGGGMGLVYRVWHRGWDTELAVKSPRPELFTSEEQKRNFVREAEAWSSLELHPNVVTCAYVRTLGGVPRVFAEWVSGGSLREWVRDRRLYEGGTQRALGRILDVAIQSAWGLGYAHDRELVHQDVKPANLLIGEGQTVKVADFGLARARAATAEAHALDRGRSILKSRRGLTRAYASPEQVAGTELGRATDVWSWGVSLLELFVGDVTWMTGAAAPLVLASYLRGDLPAADPTIPPMPGPVIELLSRCFERDPVDRPNTAMELADRLVETYEQELGEGYGREPPNPGALLADGLSNQALSMLDLGRIDEAEALWERALAADPRHPHSAYNLGLHRWRSARVTDEQIVRELEAVRASHPDDWLGDYLLALIHLERGDGDSARALLENVAYRPPPDPELSAAIARAQRQQPSRVTTLVEGGYIDESGARAWGGYLGPIDDDNIDFVDSVALSSDGRIALTSGYVSINGAGYRAGPLVAGTLVWDIVASRLRRGLTGHTSDVKAVALTADGRVALSGSDDNTARVWDVRSGRCLHTLEGHKGFVRAVAISADGQVALTAEARLGGPDRVHVWEPMTGTHIRTLALHSGSVTSVAINSDGRVAISADSGAHGDGVLRILDLQTGRRVRTLKGHVGWVRSVALSADGRLALSGGNDQTVRAWDVHTGRCLHTFNGHSVGVKAVSLTNDGRLALSGGDDRTVRLWDCETARCLTTLEGQTDWLQSIAFSATGHLAVIADTALRVWELGESSPSPWSYARPLSAVHVLDEARSVREAVERVRRSMAEGDYAVAANELRHARATPGYRRYPELLRLWRTLASYGPRTHLLGAWQGRALRGHVNAVRSVALAGDGRLALSGSDDETARVWMLDTARCARILPGHTAPVTSVALSDDGRIALTGSTDETVRVWNVHTGRCLHILNGHQGRVNAVALSLDGKLALSGGEDMILRAWDVDTGRCVHALRHTDWVDSVGLSGDGRVALSASMMEETIRIWQLQTEHCQRTIESDSGWVTAATLSRDASLALTSTHSGSVWDVNTGRCLTRFSHDPGNATGVALSPDGRLALSSTNTTIYVWEVETGNCLGKLADPTGSVLSVALSVDAGLALAGTYEKIVQVWELDWDYEL
jgi:WD40 repeat protein/serine/threonine protein kinase